MCVQVGKVERDRGDHVVSTTGVTSSQDPVCRDVERVVTASGVYLVSVVGMSSK